MKISKVKAIKDYFGFRPGEKASDFMKEIKALDDDEKLELAQGAAAELGLSQDQCDFSLA